MKIKVRIIAGHLLNSFQSKRAKIQQFVSLSYTLLLYIAIYMLKSFIVYINTQNSVGSINNILPSQIEKKILLFTKFRKMDRYCYHSRKRIGTSCRYNIRWKKGGHLLPAFVECILPDSQTGRIVSSHQKLLLFLVNIVLTFRCN